MFQKPWSNQALGVLRFSHWIALDKGEQGADVVAQCDGDNDVGGGEHKNREQREEIVEQGVQETAFLVVMLKT